MAVDTAAALRKLQSGQTLTAAEKSELGIGGTTSTIARLDAAAAANAANAANTIAALKDLGVSDVTPTVTKPINQMTPEELKAYQAARLANITKTRETGGGTTPPYEAPAGTHWSFIGGKWTLYKDPVAPQVTDGGVGGNNGNGNTGDKGDSGNTLSTPTTNIDVLKSLLKGAGYSAKLIDSSATYLQQLLKDGIDYDNAVELFLNTKEYTTKSGTKIQSPFYTEYGYLNESSPRPLAASELYGLVEGVKNLVTKYNLNSKFATPESLKKYVSNEVSVSDLEARANTARLKALESDTSYVTALQKLGFIGTAADLTDFYMDPTIGQDTLEMNKRMGTFGAEAIRRASAGIEFGKQQQELAKQLSASTQLKGQDIGAYAATGYANIAETLLPLTSLTGIYERSGLGAKKQDLIQGQIQSELEQEEFMGTASARRKRLFEQNKRAFEAAPGTTQYSLRNTNVSGIL